MPSAKARVAARCPFLESRRMVAAAECKAWGPGGVSDCIGLDCGTDPARAIQRRHRPSRDAALESLSRSNSCASARSIHSGSSSRGSRVSSFPVRCPLAAHSVRARLRAQPLFNRRPLSTLRLADARSAGQLNSSSVRSPSLLEHHHPCCRLRRTPPGLSAAARAPPPVVQMSNR